MDWDTDIDLERVLKKKGGDLHMLVTRLWH